MKRAVLILLVLMLAACKEEVAALPEPVVLSEGALGHFCQMDLLEHPGPKAQVHLDGLPGAPLFFSQVRDAVTYARLPEQSHEIRAIFVNDMAVAPSWDDPGAANWIPADSALYVVGSSRAGGMGAPEFVPFSSAAAAAAFADQHGGTVMSLAEIPDAAIFAPATSDIGNAAADNAGSENAGSENAGAEEDDYSERLRRLTEKAGG
jgi:copper chaperone NosL